MKGRIEMIGWLALTAAIVTEVAGTTAMKLSYGFSRLVPSICMACFYVVSFSLLAIALKYIAVSSAYAIWSGVGTALVAVIGFWYFRETVTVPKLVSIALIIAGVIGLKMAPN